MEGFTFASALDLNMGYYHINLDADAQNLCAIVFPWEKYKYKHLPEGIKFAPDVFNNVLSKLVQDMEHVTTYLDDLMVLTNKNNIFKDHLLKLEMALGRLSTNGMRVNNLNSNFFPVHIEYLRYWITRQVINLYVTRLR
jgi:hypothetical protein